MIIMVLCLLQARDSPREEQSAVPSHPSQVVVPISCPLPGCPPAAQRGFQHLHPDMWGCAVVVLSCEGFLGWKGHVHGMGQEGQPRRMEMGLRDGGCQCGWMKGANFPLCTAWGWDRSVYGGLGPSPSMRYFSVRSFIVACSKQSCSMHPSL